jgi:hypothetical protein
VSTAIAIFSALDYNRFSQANRTGAAVNFRSFSMASLLAVILCACGGADKTSAPAMSPAQPSPTGPGAALAPQLDMALRADQVADLRRVHPGLAQKSFDNPAGAGRAAIAIDTADREAVRHFYNALFAGAPDAPMEWTGSYATGAAGTVGVAYQDATLLRINWFRAMAGLPSVTLSPDTSAKAQEAAMMMSVNGQLSHFPPTTWKGYSAIGADAAGNSNLALGSGGAGAINQYVSDFGDNNAIVGHRRWLFYPQTRQFGSGSVPGDGVALPASNALWVFDGNYYAPRPAVRDEFVAWPPRGNVPYPVVYARWSFSYPNADFTKAAVTLTKDGASVAVTLETVQNGYAENTLVWRPANISANSAIAKPDKDEHYRVTVSNVMLAGVARTFSYDVTVFDPAVGTPGAPLTTLNLPAQVDKGASFELQLSPMRAATAYNVAGYRRRALDGIAYNPTNAAGNWSAQTTGAYSAIGGAAFRLVHATYADQLLSLNKQLLVGANGSVTLRRSTGYAGRGESMRIQVSADNGISWSDAYAETGTDLPSPETTVVASLSRFAGSSVRLRLALTVNGSYYPCDSCGWTISNVAFSGVDELLDAQSFSLPVSSARLGISLGKPGDYVFIGRTEYQDRYYSDWGPAAFVHVDGALLTGKRSNYTITRSATGIVIVDNVGADGRQTVSNPFRVDFTDISIAFDTAGNAGKAYRLYQAALNRRPDIEGMGFWIKALDAGLTLDQMAGGFTASPEFQRLYGSKPSNDQMIVAAYSNVLHRAPDKPGYDFWMGHLNSGMTTESLLLWFSDSPENQQQVAPAIADGIEFVRR